MGVKFEVEIGTHLDINQAKVKVADSTAAPITVALDDLLRGVFNAALHRHLGHREWEARMDNGDLVTAIDDLVSPNPVLSITRTRA